MAVALTAASVLHRDRISEVPELADLALTNAHDKAPKTEADNGVTVGHH
jgi:hypothetical protein